MNFDPRDLYDSNLALLNEARAELQESSEFLITVATWGRGADPDFLGALQPYRHGLGFNGSIVARVPLDFGKQWLPPEAWEAVELEMSASVPVFCGVFKDWSVEVLGG